MKREFCVVDYIMQLPDSLRTEVYRNLSLADFDKGSLAHFRWCMPCVSVSVALMVLFDWSASVQGAAYWARVCREYERSGFFAVMLAGGVSRLYFAKEVSS